MDRRYTDMMMRAFGASRSRRHLLGTAAKGTLGGVGAAMLGRGLSGGLFEHGAAPAVYAQADPCPATGEVFVRRNIYDLDPEGPEIASLRRGVAEMMRRSDVNPDDPKGWLFQANLHAIPAILDPAPTWCQHLSWFFLPWHRMYLYWFERILRDASGDPTLTLPYWNYSDVDEHKILPLVFREERDPDGNPNPLHTPRRNQAINHPTTPAPLSAGGVSYAEAFDDFHIRFFPDPLNPGLSFGGDAINAPANRGTGVGQLEATPHGNVHVEVGSFIGTIEFTGPVFTAPATILYHCDFHTGMSGTIEVVDNPAMQVGTYGVRIVDNAFVPQTRTIPVGSSVNWINLGDSPHTATADAASFDSGAIEPAGLMLIPHLAARDPIFWLHHCNIDRLWQRWLALKGGRANPLGEAEWMDQDFTFPGHDGVDHMLLVSQMVDPAGCLGYRYDDPATEFTLDPAPPEAGVNGAGATPAALATPVVTLLGASSGDQPIELVGERVTTTIELAPPAEAAVNDIVNLGATPEAGALPPQLVLSLEGMRYEGGPLNTYEVYVNLPEDAEAAPDGDYFVGTIYLFGLLLGLGHDMPGDGVRQDFVINRVVEAQVERGEWGDNPVVTYARKSPAVAPDAADDSNLEAAQPDEDAGPSISIERVTFSSVE